MTREELEAIKRRAEAATPGPWKIDKKDTDLQVVITAYEETAADIDPIAPPLKERKYVCQTSYEHHRCPNILRKSFLSYEPYHHSKADAEFIAAARSDVPALVAEVEKMRELLEDVENYISRTAEAGAGKLEKKICEALGEK